MAKIDRKHQKIFGVSAPTKIGVFGSLAAGSPDISTDPDDIQSLGAYDNAWNDAVVGDNLPAIEDFNALEYNDTYQLAYLFQAGIPEWNTDTVYYTNSMCRIDNTIYVSKVDNNTGNNPVGDTTNWGAELLFANLFHQNYFDNGGMQIYQRAAAHTLVKDVYGFAIDRWAGMATGAAVSAGTLTQATASTLNDTGLSAKFAGITLTGTGILYFRQRIASQIAVNLKNKTVCIQSMVKHDVGSSVNYTIYVRKADALNDFTTSTNIGNSSAIAVASGSNTKIKYENLSLGDCSNGLEIEVKVECGAITTKNFEFANLKLEIGSLISNFISDDYSEDLQECLAYYEYNHVKFYVNGIINMTKTESFSIEKVKIPIVTYGSSFLGNDLPGNTEYIWTKGFVWNIGASEVRFKWIADAEL